MLLSALTRRKDMDVTWRRGRAVAESSDGTKITSMSPGEEQKRNFYHSGVSAVPESPDVPAIVNRSS